MALTTISTWVAATAKMSSRLCSSCQPLNGGLP